MIELETVQTRMVYSQSAPFTAPRGPPSPAISLSPWDRRWWRPWRRSAAPKARSVAVRDARGGEQRPPPRSQIASIAGCRVGCLALHPPPQRHIEPRRVQPILFGEVLAG